MANESPVIVLPEDEVRRRQLSAKLTEYNGRIDPYCAPELQMDTICKIAVLERLLRDGKVKTLDLSFELVEKYGLAFDHNVFNNACGVIDDYCRTGGANVHGSAGLPNRILRIGE